jgi:hypothetical protein
LNYLVRYTRSKGASNTKTCFDFYVFWGLETYACSWEKCPRTLTLLGIRSDWPNVGFSKFRCCRVVAQVPMICWIGGSRGFCASFIRLEEKELRSSILLIFIFLEHLHLNSQRGFNYIWISSIILFFVVLWNEVFN